jgi:hypothetical protein
MEVVEFGYLITGEHVNFSMPRRHKKRTKKNSSTSHDDERSGKRRQISLLRALSWSYWILHATLVDTLHTPHAVSHLVHLLMVARIKDYTMMQVGS